MSYMTLEQAMERNPYDPNRGSIGAYIRYLRYNVDGWYFRDSKDIRKELTDKNLIGNKPVDEVFVTMV